MNKALSGYILRNAKKMKAIEYKGGMCSKCTNTTFEHLCFHHIIPGTKEHNINILLNGRWSTIKKEIDKCDLVCHNCHTEIHDAAVDKSSVKYDNKRSINKSTFLKYKKSDNCEMCGYGVCQRSLQFHHEAGSEKEFILSSVSQRIHNVDDMSSPLKYELDKCKVLCSNCHKSVHFEREKYNKHKDEIEKKSSKLFDRKEKISKIDRQFVKKLLDEKYSQKDISIKLNASKGAICNIVKEFKNTS